MKYFFDYFDTLKSQMAGRDLFLFLDYDGTLTPIVDHPSKAAFSKATSGVLTKLAKAPFFHVSVVSGRALWDVRSRIGIMGITYMGNHGLEIETEVANFQGFDLLRSRQIIEYLKSQINQELMFFPGSFIEDKGICLSVHYRKLNDRQAEILKTFLNELTREFALRKQVYLGFGKKVFEIKPPIDWDKGKAVQWLLDKHQYDHLPQVSVYIGDDLTDEDAFCSLKGKGITIKVGSEGPSAADYFLKDQREVIKVLKGLLDLNREA